MMEYAYIFGAHSRGQTAWIYLHKLNPDMILLGYLYDNQEDNPVDIKGVPVYHIDGITGFDNTELDLNAKVYLGIKGVGHQSAKKTLLRIGFRNENIIPVTPSVDMEMRNNFFELYFKEKGKIFNKIISLTEKDSQAVSELRTNNQKVVLYVIRSVFDKPLIDTYTSYPHEQEIQVGSEMTDKRLTLIGKYGDEVLCDNVGINISDRNIQFCEMTGMYWIWKNSDADVVGLEHYRRHFLLPENWMSQMKDVDVILATPLYIHPNLEENYRTRHDGRVLDCVYSWMKCHSKDGYDSELFRGFMADSVFSPCNMLIAKREVFNAFCEWVFPIIFAVNEEIGELEDKYQNRYPGFITERLMSYFFTCEESRYNVMYADKNFLM